MTIPADSLRPVREYTVDTGRGVVSLTDRDRTRPFLLLHGGGGATTMTGFADLLAERTHARVLLPTHPGFSGTPRAEGLTSTEDLAALYLDLLAELDVTDVTVIGNSFGGWLALEMALLKSPRVSGVVIVDAIGVEVDAYPLADVSGLSASELLALSFHDPAQAPLPPARPGDAPAGPSPDVAALIGYTGPTMSDPTLLNRLSGVEIPALVVWGRSDRIVVPDYGQVLADALPLSTFAVLPNAGHFPQLETPEQLLGTIFDLGT